MEYKRIAPDTNILIEGIISKNKIKANEIIIHEAVISYFETLANDNKTVGSLGLDEINKIKENNKYKIIFSGMRPSPLELQKIEAWEIDTKVRQLCFEEDAVFITTDKTQAKIAKSKSISFELIVSNNGGKIKLDSYFDKSTMSVHLREGVFPTAKKGKPGSWTFKELGKKKITQNEIQEISREIIESSKSRNDGFIEIERPGSTIVQLGKYRIVITRPPFSDGWEITAVQPVKQMELSQYSLSDKLMERITDKAEGILIAGSPGMGKSTFASALAIYYADQDKIVKTVEAPRDLVLPEKITQYAISHGDGEEIHDILLLSRPDFTFFDEMRNTGDFKLFADLRLAGIGFIGIVHATQAIDAIQRFVGRIELGVIPQVIDTVIFIKNGEVAKILSLKILVKVPAGMTESDLARPVVVVNDFETGKPEFEMYSYGEDTVVIPVTSETKGSPARELAKKQIESEMRRYTKNCVVEMLSDTRCRVFVPEEKIPKIIGKQGKQISEIEKQIGISIDVAELSNSQLDTSTNKTSKNSTKQSLNKLSNKSDNSNFEGKTPISYQPKIMAKAIVFIVDFDYIGVNADIIIDGDYLLTAKISNKGQIKIKKNNKIGKILTNAVSNGENLELLI